MQAESTDRSGRERVLADEMQPREAAGIALSEFPDVGRVEEVAAVLRCSKWCVYDLIAAGTLKSIRLGRSIRVTRRALEEFLST